MNLLNQLNKINREGVEAIKGSVSFQDNLRKGKRYLKDAADYRNKLLKTLEGKEVELKGYLVDEFSKNNYTIVCAEVYYKGVLIDTLHHLNIFEDMFHGKYSKKELNNSVENCKKHNVAPLKSLYVELRGEVYRYGAKYSVGTSRQVSYANKNFN